MIIDVTTKITKEFLDWIASFPKDKHVETGHVGTHLDVYQKSEIPLDYFQSKAVFIDVSHIGETRDIEVKDLNGIDIPKGAFVLIRTGRIEKHAYGEEGYFKDHPQLSHELIEYLLTQEIHFIGIDCSGIRRGSEHQPADELCEQNGCYVIENLSSLEELVDKDIKQIYTMWLDHPTATGIQVRVLAEI